MSRAARRVPPTSMQELQLTNRQMARYFPGRHQFATLPISTLTTHPDSYYPLTSFRFNSNVHNRQFSTSTNNNGQLRIAIVGGGAAGLTAALHLAPLVSAGLVAGPVDVYESTVLEKCAKDKDKTRHEGGRQLYPGSGARGRDIGVGIWSTAWWPFLQSLEAGASASSSTTAATDDNSTSFSTTSEVTKQKYRQSYQTLLQDLEMCGSYVGDVGYRTPDGSWLVRSELNAKPFGIDDLLAMYDDEGKPDRSSNINNSNANCDPALLFVREKDLLSCLRNAVKIEQSMGTICLNSGVRVDGIENVNGDMGSLTLSDATATTSDATPSSQTTASPQYHLIIAADGLNSTLRSRYAGHHSTHATGTGIASPSTPSSNTSSFSMQYAKWEHTQGQRLATLVEDREYIVFRGNAPKLDTDEEDGSGSFQSWGEERSMRFAAVPFRHACDDEDSTNDIENGDTSFHYSKSKSFKKKDDEEVWFATISPDDKLYDAYNDARLDLTSEERKQLLLDAFGCWHKPVKKLIETTPADDIMYEKAVAHRHNAGPVTDVAQIMEFEKWKAKKDKDGSDASTESSDSINGSGPLLVFIGDSMMTVDPVLAQGFTMAMESGASIAHSVESTFAKEGDSTPVYKPQLLRQELLQRHTNRERRLLNLLRSTELVQRMAQPHGMVSGVLATWIVRPMMKFCPEVVKKGVFDYMIRYSLGLTSRSGGR